MNSGPTAMPSKLVWTELDETTASGSARRPDPHPIDGVPDAHPVGGPPLVHLVGAGPGDPDLLTVRADRLLRTADVVAHDLLVAPEVLALARPGARLVPVGRRAGHAPWTMEAVAALLADRAHAGECVVRLKGGDSMVFGRGGEEALQLAERGVAVSFVPGITSAVAAPELAGIPVTHRGVSGSVTIATARCSGGGVHPDLVRAAGSTGTLVVLMAVDRLREVTEAVIAGGRHPHTPAAIVSRAGNPNQSVWADSLAGLVELVADVEVPRPALLVVGDVVALRRDWSRVATGPAARSA